MKCWRDDCENPVQASCPFCGRFVCKEHASRRPYILAMFLGANNTPKVVPVADAIWCTECEPQDAIPMPELY
jgi:hypothetical protein